MTKTQRRFIDPKLLGKQALTLWRWKNAIQKTSLRNKEEKKKLKKEMRDLEGVWNLLHIILDDLDTCKECVLEDLHG